MSFIPDRDPPNPVADLLTVEYHDAYAEAHRRRPSKLGPDTAIVHLAIWHPREFRRTFRIHALALLSAFEGMWLQQRGAPPDPFTEELKKKTVSRIFHNYVHNREQKGKLRVGVPLLLEFREEKNPVGVYKPDPDWRVEFHREYITISHFAPLTIEPLQRSVIVTDRHSGTQIQLYDVVGEGLVAHGDLGTVIWSRVDVRVGARLRQARDAVENRLRILVRRKPSVLITPEDSVAGKIFAAFLGYVVSPEIFRHVKGPQTRGARAYGQRTPAFADWKCESIEPVAARRTPAFMDRIYDSLKGDFLNNVDAESVACYMQSGHALYISSIGSRASETDVTPLHYLLLHEKFDPLSQPERRLRWRLIRLVGRLHDVGVARLAALRHMNRMKDFAQNLREAESEIEPLLEAKEAPRTECIGQVRQRLFRTADGRGESVLHRSAMARHYMRVVDRVSADLSIVPIPGWQPYDAFVRRRLSIAFDGIGNIGRRFERVLSTLDSLYQARIATDQADTARDQARAADEQTKLQQAADVVGLIIVAYYVAQICKYAYEAMLLPFGRWFGGEFPSISVGWHAPPDAILPGVWLFVVIVVFLVGAQRAREGLVQAFHCAPGLRALRRARARRAGQAGAPRTA